MPGLEPHTKPLGSVCKEVMGNEGPGALGMWNKYSPDRNSNSLPDKKRKATGMSRGWDGIGWRSISNVNCGSTCNGRGSTLHMAQNNEWEWWGWRTGISASQHVVVWCTHPAVRCEIMVWNDVLLQYSHVSVHHTIEFNTVFTDDARNWGVDRVETALVHRNIFRWNLNGSDHFGFGPVPTRESPIGPASECEEKLIIRTKLYGHEFLHPRKKNEMPQRKWDMGWLFFEFCCSLWTLLVESSAIDFFRRNVFKSNMWTCGRSPRSATAASLIGTFVNSYHVQKRWAATQQPPFPTSRRVCSDNVGDFGRLDESLPLVCLVVLDNVLSYQDVKTKIKLKAIEISLIVVVRW